MQSNVPGLAGGQSRAATLFARDSGHVARGQALGSRMIPPTLRCAGRRTGRSATTATNNGLADRVALRLYLPASAGTWRVANLLPHD